MNGLPDMLDSGRVPQDRDKLIRLAEGENGDGLVLGVKPGDVFFTLDCPPSGPDLDDHLSGNALNRPAPGNALNHPAPGNFNFKDSKDVRFFRVWVGTRSER